MAFSVLSSLAQTADRILNDDRYPISVDGKHRLESIYEKVSSLQQFLQNFRKEADGVERRIRIAANEAEDIIEHFMYEQNLSFYKLMRAADAGIATVRSKRLYDFHELKWAIEEINSVSSELLKLGDARLDHFPAARSSSPTVFFPTGDNILVGFHEDFRLQILDLLCGQSSNLEAISIVGMTGIGKTTMSRMLYDDRLVREHFDVRGWITVSQDYVTQNMISNLLDSIRGIETERSGKSTDSIEEEVHKYLYGRKYFIVLDDLWSVEAWDKVKRILPDNRNGSRVMLTTRLLDVASSVSGYIYQMPLLDENKSWNLLQQKVFREENYPLAQGFHEELRLEILDRLCGQPSKLEVVSIVGMGGIGKTTLARMLYDDRILMEHFDVCGWVTVSQDYESQKMILNLLDSIHRIDTKGSGKRTDSIEEEVDKYFYGRRYFIVLDDLWSVEAWDKVKRILPDNKNGSRVMLTTRLSDVASSVSGYSYQMPLLDENQSCNFLRQKVFGEEEFPLELDEIGKKIAKRCYGLPLAIVLIAGVLSTVSMTLASWMEIQENLHSALDNKEETGHWDKILSLSYAHLSHHLRPCFLYIGSFPEDYEIRVSKLIKLWIAEGFVKPNVSSESYEESAEVYLDDLVKQNLVLVTSRKTNGKIKTCSLHDLVHEFSRRKAHDENFKRRVSIAYSDLKNLVTTYASTIRSVICFEPSESSLGALRKCKLLRVLDVNDANVYSLPAQVFELFHLRYLAFDCPMKIPAAISMLQNLHTLIISRRKGSKSHWMDEVYLPLEIWNLPLLRHLISFCDLLPDPEGVAFALQNLQTLSVVKKLVCTKSMLLLIPNLKKLEVTYFGYKYRVDYQLENLVYLRHLETLKLINIGEFFPELKVNPVFPKSLKKLTLSGWQFPWEYMRIVGSLPNLQVLKLRDFACKGDKWETTEGEFPCLKYLLIQTSDLHDWITESSHFPRLERLVLYWCAWLDEIPSAIGDIPTLELIEVYQGKKSMVDSAKRIQEDQQAYGNKIQVRCVRCHYQGF